MVDISKDLVEEMEEIEWRYIQSLVREIDRKQSRHIGVNIFVAVLYVDK